VPAIEVSISIVNDWPPNIRSIRAVLPVSERNIFAYGGIIYNPGGGGLSPELVAHEAVHFEQQRKLNRWYRRNGAEVWWRRFLRDPEFRLEQELEAHRAEYREFCRLHSDRNERQRALRVIAGKLAKPMYGGIITVSEAIKAIQ
jgi:hypothetical protein